MKKIVAMGLLVILLFGKISVGTIYADTLDESQQGEIANWTDEEIKADFMKKYFEEVNYIKEAIPSKALNLMKEYLYITEEERREVAKIIGSSEITEGVLYSLMEGEVAISFSLNGQNKILKTLLYTDNEEYSLVNTENEQVTVFSAMGVKNVRCLLQHELDEFKKDVRDLLVPDEEMYSLEYMRTYLESKHAEEGEISCYSNARATNDVPVVEISSIQESDNYGEIIADLLGTYYIEIDGSSEYTKQETDTIAVDVYFSRPEFYQLSEETMLFETGTALQTISELVQCGLDWIEGALSMWNLVDFTLELLTADVEIVCEQVYQVVQYRESTTMDYTVEMAKIEIMERDCFLQVALGFDEYNEITDEYGAPNWTRISGEFFDESIAEFAEESANVYYNNCKNLNGWQWGPGFLAGSLIELESNYHTHSYSGVCDEYCNNCNFYRRDAFAHNYSTICDEYCNICSQYRQDAEDHVFTRWIGINAAYHRRSCTRSGCGLVEEESHSLNVDQCITCGWDGPIVDEITWKLMEQEGKLEEILLLEE